MEGWRVGWRVGFGWSCLEVGWCCLLDTTDTVWDVGGRQCLVVIGAWALGPAIDGVDWKFQADGFYELSHTRLTGVRSDEDKCLLSFL